MRWWKEEEEGEWGAGGGNAMIKKWNGQGDSASLLPLLIYFYSMCANGLVCFSFASNVHDNTVRLRSVRPLKLLDAQYFSSALYLQSINLPTWLFVSNPAHTTSITYLTVSQLWTQVQKHHNDAFYRLNLNHIFTDWCDSGLTHLSALGEGFLPLLSRGFSYFAHVFNLIWIKGIRIAGVLVKKAPWVKFVICAIGLCKQNLQGYEKRHL